MPRKSLRPNLNQIRAWVRQGRTDAWVAHQLDVSVRDIEQFKRQNELVSDEPPAAGTIAADYPDEIDLRAEDDALIAAELEAAEIEAARARAEMEERTGQEEEEAAVAPARGGPAGEVGRLAHVAAEGRIHDHARLPRPGILGGHPHRHLQAPARALRVQVCQLRGREAPAQAAAQLCHERGDHALQLPSPLRRLGPQAPLALLPLVDGVLERGHAAPRLPAPLG